MLEAWRTREKVSRAELAKRAETSEVSIWRIETGNQTPSPKLAKRLEAVTGIPASKFIFGASEAA